MPKFREQWTFRTPEQTVTYEAGMDCPTSVIEAAREDGAIEEESHGDDVDAATASPSRRARSAKGE